MGHLIISRRPGESFFLRLADDGNPERLLQSLTGDGIEVHVVGLLGRQVRISLDAPRDLNIVRSELVEQS